MQIWCDGQFLAAENFPPSITDRGFTHGLGLFETLLARDGWPMFLSRHAERLLASGLTLGWELLRPDFHGIAVSLLERNGLANGSARIRIGVSAGSGPLHDLQLGNDAHSWMTADALAESPSEISAMLSPWPRNERSPLVGLKCASYAENLIALDHARRHGFDEVIFLNTAGNVCEAATANLFLVKYGRLQTPPLASGCLPGIGRELVLELAAQLGIPASSEPLTKGELEQADEIFLTSSLRGIRKVSRYDRFYYPAHSVTSQLQNAWQENFVLTSPTPPPFTRAT